MNYPVGAINTIEDFIAHTGKPMWHVSQLFSNRSLGYSKMTFTGNMKIEMLSSGPSPFFECIADGFKNYRSLNDCNIGRNFGYNDWFLFTNIEDARKYLNLCPCCGK